MEIDVLAEKVEALSQRFDDRFDMMEGRFDSHMANCRELCIQKISMAQGNADKAHTRLDHHAKEIKCIADWKNQMKGRMWILPFIIAPITSAITALVVVAITGGGTQ